MDRMMKWPVFSCYYYSIDRAYNHRRMSTKKMDHKLLMMVATQSMALLMNHRRYYLLLLMMLLEVMYLLKQALNGMVAMMNRMTCFMFILKDQFRHDLDVCVKSMDLVCLFIIIIIIEKKYK